jgi:hypothetical protein
MGLLWACVVASAPAFAQSVPGMPSAGACGSLSNAFGPWDYRADHFVALPGDSYSHAYKLNLVEKAHFTPEVEMLVKGHSSYLGGDLDYTLRAFPNHIRALVSIMRYAERYKVTQVPNMPYSVECYFRRALVFKPDDGGVRVVFSAYLNQLGRKDDALQQLRQASTLAADNAYKHYIVGLAFVDLGEYALALAEAHHAEALGLPVDALKNKLVAAGKWADAASAPH